MDLKIPKFKIQKKFRKGGFRTNPDVAWEIVIYVAALGVLALFVLSFILFRQIEKEFTATSADETKTKIVNKEKLDHALQYFSDREAKSNNILNSPAPFVDPSL